MKKVVALRLALIAAVLLTASVASAADTIWTRPTTSGPGNWNDAANWDTGVPSAATGKLYIGYSAANLAEVQVTDAQVTGSDRAYLSSYGGPVTVRIMNGGNLTCSTNTYVGLSNPGGHLIIEDGGSLTGTAVMFCGYTGSLDNVIDIAGTLDTSQGGGKWDLTEAGGGQINVLAGGLLKVRTFADWGWKLPPDKSVTIDIQGSGKITCAGNVVTDAETLIAGGHFSGNGVVDEVVVVYNAGADETSITVVPAGALTVNVGADQDYDRGVVPLALAATVNDDEDPAPAVLTWSQTAGPGTATFATPNSATTDVTFNAGGVYTLRLTADNTAGGGSEVVYDELDVTVSSPSCQDVIDAGLLLTADVNKDCYVNMADLAEIAAAWLNCNNPQDIDCVWTYPILNQSIALVQDGQPATVIVIGQGASTAERYAADELQLYLEKISGATVPIVIENGEIPAAAVVIGTPATCQYIADSELIDTSSLGRDGLLIKTVDNTLILAGENPPGALYAAYAFLEEHLGCRWYFPGDDGEYVPSMTNIVIDPIDDSQIPAMQYRGINPVATTVYDPEISDWMGRNRMNNIRQIVLQSYHRARADEVIKKGVIFSTDALFSQWLSLYDGDLFADHPEYFPLIDGVRTEDGGQYCLSNLGFVTEIADIIEDFVTLFPDVEALGVNQQDSMTWCECSECAAMGTKTDQLHTFLNRLAAELGPVLDNRVLLTQAYQNTEDPPTNVIPNEKTVIYYCLIPHCSRHGWNEGCPVQEAQKPILNDWLQYGNPIVAYTYHAEFSTGFPAPFAYHSSDAMKYYHSIGMSGWYPETAPDNPGGDPLQRDPELLWGDQWYGMKEMYYTAAKTLWDPSVTPDDIKDDFFPKFYGAAGPAMRNYYDTLEQAWHYPGDVLYPDKWLLGYNPSMVIDFLSPTLIDTMNGYLADAVALYTGQPQVIKDRVDRDVEMFAKWEKRYEDTGGVATER